MKAPRDPLTDAEKTELSQAVRAVEHAEQQLAAAQQALNLAAGRIAATTGWGRKAAVGRHCGWSREHASRLAAAFTAGQLDNKEEEAA
ncbi:hypothetical protein [Streptomyces sp. NPDC000961]|uniref:hypothetical protein n=1 Tax=unclassified Streptomyces TaxID=2593676 RepID=UPI0036C1953C